MERVVPAENRKGWGGLNVIDDEIMWYLAEMLKTDILDAKAGGSGE